MDALIVMSDRDSDWELDLEEFRNCLDPEAEPPKKRTIISKMKFINCQQIRTVFKI